MKPKEMLKSQSRWIKETFAYEKRYIYVNSADSICHMPTRHPGKARREMSKVLQCVAACCSVLQCVAVCCSVLQCVAVCVDVCV